MSKALSLELSRLIFGSIGAVPIQSSSEWKKRNNGLIDGVCLRKEKITVEIDGTRFPQPIWFGEILDGTGSCQAIGTLAGSEYVLILQQGDARIGLRFDWGDDDGLFLVQSEDKWIPMSLSQKLMIAMVMNDIADEGCVWEVPVNGMKTWEPLYEALLSLIEHEEVDTGDEAD